MLTARERGEDNHLASPLAALKRDALIALRRRFGVDRTGRGSAWIFDYDVASALSSETHRDPGPRIASLAPFQHRGGWDTPICRWGAAPSRASGRLHTPTAKP